jgi:hypothetical protein
MGAYTTPARGTQPPKQSLGKPWLDVTIALILSEGHRGGADAVRKMASAVATQCRSATESTIHAGVACLQRRCGGIA